MTWVQPHRVDRCSNYRGPVGSGRVGSERIWTSWYRVGRLSVSYGSDRVRKMFAGRVKSPDPTRSEPTRPDPTREKLPDPREVTRPAKSLVKFRTPPYYCMLNAPHSYELSRTVNSCNSWVQQSEVQAQQPRTVPGSCFSSGSWAKSRR